MPTKKVITELKPLALTISSGQRIGTIKSEAVIKKKAATGEISWDIEQAKANPHSRKDEILTIIYSIPLVLAFVPGCEDIVKRGFAVLDECPDWYKLSLGVIISASFGMRGASKFMGRKK